jgi:hypothetical protein
MKYKKPFTLRKFPMLEAPLLKLSLSKTVPSIVPLVLYNPEVDVPVGLKKNTKSLFSANSVLIALFKKNGPAKEEVENMIRNRNMRKQSVFILILLKF